MSLTNTGCFQKHPLAGCQLREPTPSGTWGFSAARLAGWERYAIDLPFPAFF